MWPHKENFDIDFHRTQMHTHTRNSNPWNPPWTSSSLSCGKSWLTLADNEPSIPTSGSQTLLTLSSITQMHQSAFTGDQDEH